MKKNHGTLMVLLFCAFSSPAFADTTAAAEQTPVQTAPVAASPEQSPAPAAVVVTDPQPAVQPIQEAVPVVVDAATAAAEEARAKMKQEAAQASAAVQEQVKAPEAIPAAPAVPVVEQTAPPALAAAPVPVVEEAAAPKAEENEIVLPGDAEVSAWKDESGESTASEPAGSLAIVGKGLTTSHVPFIVQHHKKPVESLSQIPAGTKNLFWFAFFDPARTNEERLKRPKFSVEWFAPGHQLVYSGTFQANIAYPDHVKTRLPLGTIGIDDPSGEWSVVVKSGNTVVDERTFQVLKA